MIDYSSQLSQLRNEGFFWQDLELNPKILEKAKKEILEYVTLDVNKKLIYNYGNSEIRIFNCQDNIPSIKPIYQKLKELNSILFNDQSEFCILAIVNNKTPSSHYKNRWHVDSLSKQYKFFFQLTEVREEDGPFEFVPYSHKFFNRFKFWISNLKNNMYIKLTKKGLITNYQTISDEIFKKMRGIKNSISKPGKLLICDVRMLHRDAPCLSGNRVSLHCYLGQEKSKFPSIRL